MSQMILFDGTKKIGNVHYLVFSIVQDRRALKVEVPIDQKIADHIMIYLNKNTKPDSKPVERGNDEDSI